jgi:hypothetical protein
MPYGPTSHFRNRVWLRQNSFSSNGSVCFCFFRSVKVSDRLLTLFFSSGDPTLTSRDAHSHSSTSSSRRNWDRSQDWKNTGDENKELWKPTNSWRNSGSVGTDIKLETVHEGDDDTVSEAHSDMGNPGLDFGRLARSSVGRASTGSMSDPGDSYGGREYCRDDFDLSIC